MMVNRQFVISVVVLFLASCVLFGAVIVPSMLKINEIRLEMATEHAKIQERYDRRNQLKQTLQSLQEIRDGIGALTTIAVRQGKELAFVQSMEDAATATNVAQELSLKTPNQVDLSAWERNVPVTLSATGAFGDVLRFLKEVERLPYMINVHSFVIRSTRPKGAVGTAAVRADLVGSTYWLTGELPAFLAQTL